MRFYRNSKGQFVPSGTTVLPSPDLKRWAANCAVDWIERHTEEVHQIIDATDIKCTDRLKDELVYSCARTAYERESMQARDYGTYIHTLCQYSLENNIRVESPHICAVCRKEYWGDYNQVCENGCKMKVYGVLTKATVTKHHELTDGFMQGLWNWKEKHNVKVIAMEHEVVTDAYGGRLDLVCEMDGVVTLVDFKTGKASYYPSWKYQLAGYRQAWNRECCPLHETGCLGVGSDECVESEGRGCANVIERHGILKFNKQTGKVNYKDFTEYQATRTYQDKPRKKNGKLQTEKYTRNYETDVATFNALVKLWWLINRGIQI